MTDHASHAEHPHHPNYVKIWAVLLALLVVSVAGPMFGIKIVTLITAFGIAIVKAYLVVKNFMHIDVAPKVVTYIVLSMVLFMLLLFAGTAADVMESHGHHWSKPDWVAGTAGSSAPADAGHGVEEAH